VFILRIWFWLQGQVLVRVQGDNQERLLNLALSRGIYVWNVHWREGYLYFRIGIRGFKRLRPLVRACHLRVRIVAKTGLPFFFRPLRRRHMLLTGAVLFLITIYAWSSCLWSMEIVGSRDPLQSKRLGELLVKRGVSRGVLKSRIDLEGIEREVLADFPDLAWARAEFTGTKFTLEVVPKLLPPEKEGPQHLVARRSGVVLDVFVLAGTAHVEKGATVRSGDILISGDQGGSPTTARGRVMARVWYEAYREGKPEETLLVRTGNTAVVQKIALLGRELLLSGPAESPFVRFETESRMKALASWRNLRAPVEVIETTYYELKEKVRQLSAEENAERLAGGVLAELKKGLAEGAQIVKVEKKVLSEPGDNLTRVRVRIETMEDIAKSVPYYPLQQEGGQDIGGAEGKEDSRSGQ
jgi:similar to stage IV sporulation protein